MNLSSVGVKKSSIHCSWRLFRDLSELIISLTMMWSEGLVGFPARSIPGGCQFTASL